MRADADKVGNFDRAFEVGAKSFLFKGINGRWREVFTTGEHRGYRHRVCPWLAPRRPLPLPHTAPQRTYFTSPRRSPSI